MDISFPHITGIWRIAFVLAIALGLHVIVIIIKKINLYFVHTANHPSLSKTRTLAGLVASVLSFAVYFVAIGVILAEFGISLTAYVASASILGFAVAFGSQGIVQDVVSGLTIIFTDLFDIGDMVEISGQVGIVKRVSMRFTVIENAMGAEVFIPNRSINSVTNYPKGYVRCLVDVTTSDNHELAEKQDEAIKALMQSSVDQFPGIYLKSPDIEGKLETSAGRRFTRIKFRIWPGRGGPIENQFKQELLQALKKIDEQYAEWMVSINYEVEKKAYIHKP